MTGFTNCLRKCFRRPAKDWKPLRAPFGKDSSEKVTVKVTAASGGRDQIEIKVKHPTFQNQQHYLLECFLFFPKELEAVKLSEFYSHLWEVVRLHKPQVLLANLAKKDWEGSLLKSLETLLQEIHLSKGNADSATVNLAIHQLQLQACLVRRAVRKAAKRIHLQISDASGTGSMGPQDAASMLSAAAAMSCDLVRLVCQVLDTFQEVCSVCDGVGMPPSLSTAWSLCEEWLLVEAERAMLRLIWDLDRCLPNINAQKQKLGRSAGWQISAVRSPQVREQEMSASRQSSAVLSSPSRQSSAALQTSLDPLLARSSLQQAALSFQNARQQKGYLESLIRLGDAYNNESYTYRTKVLKRHGQETISLLPKVQPQSQLLADVVGIIIAGIAMVVAVLGLWIGYSIANFQLNIKFVIVTVVVYSLKDRIKKSALTLQKWGERYLEPVASWFGYSFPDRIVQLVDTQGSVIGKCTESCSITGCSDVDKEVRECRWQENSVESPRESWALPERVLHFKKSMAMNWKALHPCLRDGVAMDSIMRIDLRHFCRRMEPASEPHFCMRQGPDGSIAVDKIACARVYHVNLVVRITQQSDGRGVCCERAATRMQLTRTRLILDHEGLRRLEPLGTQLLLKEGSKASWLPKPAAHRSLTFEL